MALARHGDSGFPKPGGDAEVEEIDDVCDRERFGIEPQLVERHPERVPGQAGIGHQGELGVKMIEASTAHGTSSVRKWSQRRRSVRGRVKRRSTRVRAGLLSALVCAGCGEPADPIDPARLASIARRVETIRGLAFRETVGGRWIDRSAVRSVLEAKFDRAFPSGEAAEGEQLLRDLGFWRQPESLRDALLGHDVEWLAGFYDPTPARTLYAVRDAAVDPSFQEETLVHELVHALQDQHAPAFTLENGVDQDGDLLFAFAALREGGAQWVQYADTFEREGWPIPTPAAARAEAEIGLQQRALPRLISWGRVRVYSEGYVFARRLLEVGGSAALNRALADPPISSREILHPDRHLARDRTVPFFPNDTSAWAPGCETLAGDAFGELGVGAWLADHGRDDAGSPEPIAVDWDGDRAWRLRCPSGEATVWILQFARPEAAAGMAAHAPGHLRVEYRAGRVLFHTGLPDAAREYLLEDLKAARLGGFADYLVANPGVHERAAQWTRKAAED